MKKLLTGLILIGLIVITAPFINGLLLEKTIKKSVKKANSMYADTGMGLSFEIVSYKRKFFTTDMELKLNFGSLQDVYGIEEMLFTEHAKHGYTGVVSTTTLEKNPWFTAFVDEKLQGKNPFRLKTVYSLTGDIQSTFAFEAFSFDLGGEKIAIKEGNLLVEMDTDMDTFQASGSWAGLSAADKITLGEVTMESDMELISTFLWGGYFKYSVNSLKAVGEQGQLVCENLQSQYQFNVDQANNLLSGEFDFSADKLSLADKDVDGAKIKIALNNVNKKGYEEFMKIYMELVPEIMASASALEGDSEIGKEAFTQQMSAVSLKMAAAFEKLLTKGVELTIKDLLVKLPEGDISANITLRLLKDMTFVQFSPVAMQPALALDILHAQSDVRIPATLVGEIPMLVEPAYPGMQTGIFIKNNDYLTHTAETKDGKLFLNQKEFTLQQ